MNVALVKQLTGGTGVKAVFDGVGADTFMRSLDCLRPFGMMVCFGQSSGPIPPFDVVTLSTKGSLYLTRPTIVSHATAGRVPAMADEVFGVIASGTVKIEIGQRYPLGEVARAHQDLESRRTTGSTVLIP